MGRMVVFMRRGNEKELGLKTANVPFLGEERGSLLGGSRAYSCSLYDLGIVE